VKSGRGIALVAVVLLHVGLVAVLGLAMRNRQGGATPDLVTTLIVLDLPPLAREERRPDPGMPAVSATWSTAITVPPLPPAPQTAPTDWEAAARGAAAARAPPPTRSLDHNPATEAPPASSSPSAVVHHAGEQYRDPADGTSIIYVSDHCYIASTAAAMGSADVLARARTTSTVCKGDPGWSRPDLFKDLPAYRRYHPQEPGRPWTGVPDEPAAGKSPD
jgi:hypothetical protein